jgi:ubiquinone/menaquinone biosynthesis C-methylase UbiE
MNQRNEKEEAYLYDLVLAPQWRKRFDDMADSALKLPDKGAWLEIGCGTGAYAIDLAVRGGPDVTVLGLENNAEMRVIAQGKAEMQKVKRVSFQAGDLTDTGLTAGGFDVVLGDATLAPTSALAAAFEELARVAARGATVAVKLVTRGSFAEFFSIYWEALYELDMLEHTAALESLITAPPTVSEAEAFAKNAKLKQAQSETRKETFAFTDGAAFLNDPLIRHWFLAEWLGILPNEASRQRAETKLAELIDRAREGLDFEVSIKATLVQAQK